MAKIIVIRPDGGPWVVMLTSVETCEEIEFLVGGGFEGLPVDPNCYAYVNSDGIALGLPYNRAATEFCRRHDVGLADDDFIKGVMVVAGPETDSGKMLDVPDDLVVELMDSTGN